MNTYPLKKVVIIYNISENQYFDSFLKKEFNDFEIYISKLDIHLENSILNPNIQVYKGNIESNYSFILYVNTTDIISNINRFLSNEK